MTEILKTIFLPIFSWIQKVIEFFADALDNILGIYEGIIIVYVGYIILFISLVLIASKLIKKKKYWAAAPLFIILLLMFLYTFFSIVNATNKGF